MQWELVTGSVYRTEDEILIGEMMSCGFIFCGCYPELENYQVDLKNVFFQVTVSISQILYRNRYINLLTQHFSSNDYTIQIQEYTAHYNVERNETLRLIVFIS